MYLVQWCKMWLDVCLLRSMSNPRMPYLHLVLVLTLPQLLSPTHCASSPLIRQDMPLPWSLVQSMCDAFSFVTAVKELAN